MVHPNTKIFVAMLCAPWVVIYYLCQRLYNGALHDTSEEDKVNIFGSCPQWQVFQIVQYLLHSWKKQKQKNVK